MNDQFNDNCHSLFLPSQSRKSHSPVTPKESWQFEQNIEYLKQGRFHANNVSENDPRPEITNFDRLRKSILKHKESNRNLIMQYSNNTSINHEIDVTNTHHSKSQHRTNYKMYNEANCDVRRDHSDSASKILSTRIDTDAISMPLTERGRYPDNAPQKGSKDRKSSHRK